MKLEHVVVTGASGFVGRALIHRLIQEGVEVVAIAREPLDQEGCKCVEGDIVNPGLLDEVLTPHTTVFHLASHASVAGSVRDPGYDFQVNVQGTLNVLESVRARRSSLIFTSSSAVFEPSLPLPHGETALQKPSSPYGAAKIAAEAYCTAYHRCYGTDVKIARLFNVYGPGMTRFAMRDFYKKLTANPIHLEILGDGNQIRDYLFIDDCVDGLVLIGAEGQAGEDYNLASGKPVSTMDLACLIAHTMSNMSVEISAKGESFPGDVPQWFANIDKVTALGFSPKVALDEGVQRTIAWFQMQDAIRVESEKASSSKSE